jgi:hypothetical protein
VSRWLVGCEFSGVVRRALRRRGHDAYSCDFLPAEDGSPYHYQCDVRDVLGLGWDGAIFHPTCTRLTNSGVRWLHVPPPGRTLEEMWKELRGAAAFYRELREAVIRFGRGAIENPVMHKYARELIGFPVARQVVQPWWFGDPAFKATGFELIDLPPLVATNRLTPPKRGTPEHKAWSKVHRASPGPDRWKDRSRTEPGVADAMAEQWAGVAVARQVA